MMDAPRKYWWIALVAVPIAVAVIGLVASLIGKQDSGPETPGVSYVNFGGTQTNIKGDAAFTTLNVMLDESRSSENAQLTEVQMQMLVAAMEQVEGRDFDAAIPLFEAIAQTAPSPSVLNNLAAAYQAAGDTPSAQATLERAQGLQTHHPQVVAAIQHNLRQIVASKSPPVLSAWEPTTTAGVVAAVTRCDDDGGMLTVHVTYRNASQDSASPDISAFDGYLLDEGTGATWAPKVTSGRHLKRIDPGQLRVTWMKFQLDIPLPERLTVVADEVQRSFENITCTAATR